MAALYKCSIVRTVYEFTSRKESVIAVETNKRSHEFIHFSTSHCFVLFSIMFTIFIICLSICGILMACGPTPPLETPTPPCYCKGPTSIYTVVNMICWFAFSVKLWCVSDKFGLWNISCIHYRRVLVIGVKGVDGYIIWVARERTHTYKENIYHYFLRIC